MVLGNTLRKKISQTILMKNDWYVIKLNFIKKGKYSTLTITSINEIEGNDAL